MVAVANLALATKMGTNDQGTWRTVNQRELSEMKLTIVQLKRAGSTVDFDMGKDEEGVKASGLKRLVIGLKRLIGSGGNTKKENRILSDVDTMTGDESGGDESGDATVRPSHEEETTKAARGLKIEEEEVDKDDDVAERHASIALMKEHRSEEGARKETAQDGSGQEKQPGPAVFAGPSMSGSWDAGACVQKVRKQWPVGNQGGKNGTGISDTSNIAKSRALDKGALPTITGSATDFTPDATGQIVFIENSVSQRSMRPSAESSSQTAEQNPKNWEKEVSELPHRSKDKGKEDIHEPISNIERCKDSTTSEMNTVRPRTPLPDPPTAPPGKLNAWLTSVLPGLNTGLDRSVTIEKVALATEDMDGLINSEGGGSLETLLSKLNPYQRSLILGHAHATKSRLLYVTEWSYERVPTVFGELEVVTILWVTEKTSEDEDHFDSNDFFSRRRECGVCGTSRRRMAALGEDMRRQHVEQEAEQMEEKLGLGETYENEPETAQKEEPDMSKKLIRLKDAVGRQFVFPFEMVQHWPDMEKLISSAFLHVDVVGPHVQERHYDLVGPDNAIILPEVWERIVRPGWEITMHMWPMPEPQRFPSLFPPAPPPPQRAADPHFGKVPKEKAPKEGLGSRPVGVGHPGYPPPLPPPPPSFPLELSMMKMKGGKRPSRWPKPINSKPTEENDGSDGSIGSLESNKRLKLSRRFTFNPLKALRQGDANETTSDHLENIENKGNVANDSNEDMVVDSLMEKWIEGADQSKSGKAFLY